MRKFEMENKQAGMAAGGVMAERSGAKKNVKAAECSEVSKNIAGGGCCGVTGGTDFSGTAKAAFGMLGVLFLSGVSQNALAQCVATTDCATLGYTESSCSDGGVKCPFGNYWSCRESQNNDNSSASSALCYHGCCIGHFYYTDGTCSEEMHSEKTPLGVVVYLDGKGSGQLYRRTATSAEWGSFEIPGFPYFDEEFDYYTWPDQLGPLAKDALWDFDSCGRTEMITAATSEDEAPAAWKAKNYFPDSAPETKGKWCLASMGVLFNIMNYSQTIGAALKKLTNYSAVFPCMMSYSSTLTNQDIGFGIQRTNSGYVVISGAISAGGSVCFPLVMEFSLK